jgi:hypothetical protein
LGRDLRAAYLNERRVARLLRQHGAQVPYPTLATDLTCLAGEADGRAARLADELRAVAGNTDPSDVVPVPDGRNHWERLTADLAAVESLQRRYTELALQWDVDFPATTATLHDLARAATATATLLRTMVARSDPHALD